MRPIPPQEWPAIEVDGAALNATLKTDWDGAVRYQLVVTPRSGHSTIALDDAVRTHCDSISFTILLYDKDGFQLCKKDVKPTPSADARNHFDSLRAIGSFDRFECERSAYKNAAKWNLGYVFPALASGGWMQLTPHTQAFYRNDGSRPQSTDAGGKSVAREPSKGIRPGEAVL